MYINLYLVEQLARQRRQHFVDQAAQDRYSAQLSNMKQTRSHTMKCMKVITATVIIAVTP